MGNSVQQICKSWQEGKCFGGGECNRRHYYTEDDEVLPQSKRFLDDEGGPSSHAKSNFSSPYCMNIRKETITKRRVEIDLETGRKKSWVESMEQEIVDLTGESSAKKPIRSPMMDKTNLLNVQGQPQNLSTNRSRIRSPATFRLLKCSKCDFYTCRC